jgi:hypothetical protein
MNYYYEEDINKFLDAELGKVSLTKKGQPRLRKPKEPRIYFTQETEDAIIEYLQTEDVNKRNLIYNNKIAYAFFKLAENIIHTFKFYYTDIDTLDELNHQVITFLLEKLPLYHHSKNINDRLCKIIIKEYNENYVINSFIDYTNNSITVTQNQINEFISNLELTEECLEEVLKITPPKAYSYFGTIAKRYLIVYNDKNYRKLQEKADIEEIDENKTVLYEVIREADLDNNLDTFINQYIEYIDTYLFQLFPKTHDAKTADAIMELFRKRESIGIFNKKALYIYIREITDVPTPQITKITKKLKMLYIKLYNEYYEHGYIKI